MSSAAAFSPGWGCPQRSSTGPVVSAGVAGIFGEIIVGPLQFSRAVGRIQASVSEGFPSIFAIELERLARRAFVDIDPLIQL